MKTFLTFILALGFALAGNRAEAHAFLDHADPRIGSINKTSPHLVKIWFTEELEPAFSKVEVFDAAQREVDRRDVKIDPADKTMMTVSVPDLTPGTYKVVWHAVAVDTHRTQGSFSFTVKP